MATILTDSKSCPSAHSWQNKLGRVIWAFVTFFLFRPSPRFLHGWRRLLLRVFGAQLGRNVRIDPSVSIWAPWNLAMGEDACLGAGVDCYNVDFITIGAYATVSQYAFLCSASHDVSSANMRLTTAPITIEDQAWVCARAFVSPGLTIGEGSVVGACSVVTKHVAPWKIVAGNPAKVIRNRVIDTGEATRAA